MELPLLCAVRFESSLPRPSISSWTSRSFLVSWSIDDLAAVTFWLSFSRLDVDSSSLSSTIFLCDWRLLIELASGLLDVSVSSACFASESRCFVRVETRFLAVSAVDLASTMPLLAEAMRRSMSKSSWFPWVTVFSSKRRLSSSTFALCCVRSSRSLFT